MNASIGKKLEAVCRRERQQAGLNRAADLATVAGWIVIGCGTGRWVFNLPVVWIVAACAAVVIFAYVRLVCPILGWV